MGDTTAAILENVTFHIPGSLSTGFRNEGKNLPGESYPPTSYSDSHVTQDSGQKKNLTFHGPREDRVYLLFVTQTRTKIMGLAVVSYLAMAG